MKPSFLLYILFFAHRFAFGQASTREHVDSLRVVIKEYDKEDTLYVNLRISYASHSFFVTPSDTSLINYLEKTLEISEQLNYQKGIALSFINLGIIYSQQRSDPYTAIDYYHRALAVIDKNEKLEKYTANILLNIGLIYYEQEEYEKAIVVYKQGLIKHTDSRHKATALSTLGNIYGIINKKDSAIYYYRLAEKINRENKNYLFLANDLSNMSLILHSMEKTEEALHDIMEALKLTEQWQLDYVKPTVYLNAAMIYMGTGKLKDAEKYALQSLELEASSDNLFIKKSIWGTLSEVYEAKGDYKAALYAYKNYYKLTDSLTNQNRRSEITRKVMQYEYDKRQALADAEIVQQKLVKNFTLGGSGAALLLFVFIFWGVRKQQKIKAEQKELLLKAKISETELKALRAQMNPHFIFNSLNSIADYIHKNDPKSADYYLAKFAKLMRGILENSEEKEIPLSEEIKTLELYLQLEAARLKNKFTYEIIIEEGIHPDITMVPPLILQPFVENSIWHGLSKKEGNGQLLVKITKAGNLLSLKIEDDGIGRKNTESHTKSYGMKLTQERIALFDKLKNPGVDVLVTDLEKGTRVEIKLPLTEEA